MKIKIRKGESIQIILFILTVIVYLISIDIIGIGNGSLDNIRYVVFAISIFYGYVALSNRENLIYNRGRMNGNNLNNIIYIAIIFFICSVYQATKINHPIGTRTYIQIALLLIPAMYAYCLINIIKFDSIITMFSIILFITILFYMFIEIGIVEFLKPDNYAMVSFIHSESPFETSSSADIFFALFAFFNIASKLGSDDSKRKSRICYVLSFIFTLYSFKRLAVLFVFCILIFNKFFDLKGKVPRIIPILTSLGFTFFTVLYSKFMKGELLFGFDVHNFSKGRDYILSLWAQKNYISYGYGSSFEIINRYLEMDLVQIYLEIGIIALFVFCLIYFKIASGNAYAFFLMCYQFLNMLTASSIPLPMGWIIMFVTISSLSSNKIVKDNMNISQKKRYKILIKSRNCIHIK